MRDGDIFTWFYSDPANANYQCKAQIAIFREGRLVDIFWNECGDVNEDSILDLREITFKKIANFDELEDFRDMPEFYEDKDIVDLSHRRNPRRLLLKRKGAKRSQRRMLSSLQDIFLMHSDRQKDHQKAMELVRETYMRILDGDTDAGIPN